MAIQSSDFTKVSSIFDTDAEGLSYNNQTSRLSATTVQTAIDELAASSGGSSGGTAPIQNQIEFNRETITSNKTLANNDNVYQHIICNTESLAVVLPSSPINGTHFIIKNSTSSSQPFTTNNIVLTPGDMYDIKYDGVEWVGL